MCPAPPAGSHPCGRPIINPPRGNRCVVATEAPLIGAVPSLLSLPRSRRSTAAAAATMLRRPPLFAPHVACEMPLRNTHTYRTNITTKEMRTPKRAAAVPILPAPVPPRHVPGGTRRRRGGIRVTVGRDRAAPFLRASIRPRDDLEAYKR